MCCSYSIITIFKLSIHYELYLFFIQSTKFAGGNLTASKNAYLKSKNFMAHVSNTRTAALFHLVKKKKKIILKRPVVHHGSTFSHGAKFTADP